MEPSPILKIFFSSPGDVKLERETARRIVERLQAEFGARVRLEPYFWEHEVLVATRDYQENIPPMAGFDVFVCMLWSRLGSPLDPKRHPRPDGGYFESGTEYEFSMALASHRARQAPELLIFRNRTEPRRPSRPKEAREAVDREIDRLDEFIARYLREGEYFTSAVNSYRTLGEFEDKLTAGLRALVQQRAPSAGAEARRRAASYAGRPYLGLAAFDFADARVFFGRTAQVGEIVAAFQTQELEARAAGEEGRRFVLVLGASGSGKSSLARAGVLPMLIQPGVIEGAERWRRALFRPGEAGGDPFLALAGALLAREALPELAADGTDAAALAGLLRRQPAGAGLLLRQALSQAGVEARHAEELRLGEEARRLEAEHREEDVREVKERLARLAPPPVRLALVCDQLEELFTTDRSGETTAAFVECLAALARSGRCFVLATLRSDFYPRCLEQPALVELMKTNGSFALAAPGPAELGQMIRQPAEVAGLSFERNPASGEALDELLRDAALADPAALPLLGYTLEQLHEKRTSEGVLTLAAYRQLGGLEGAIGKRAEAVFTALAGEAQAAFDGVWRQLVTLGEGGAPVRRHAAAATLATSPGAAALVEALVQARLLVADRAAGGERSVSVAHEALLQHWPRVTAWVESNREFLRARSRLATRLAEWSERGKTEDYLLPPGTALAEAENLLAAHAGVLADDESDYVRRSTARARGRELARLRRNRAITSGAVTLSVLAMVGGGFAWRERGIAEEQRLAASTNEQRAITQEKLAVEQKEAAERNAREAHASQTRAAYLLGIEMLEAGKTRAGITSLAQTLMLDPEHRGARDRLYSYHLYGLPKAVCLLSVEAPEGVRQRISGARRGPLQRVTFLDARGAPEIRELATRARIEGPWSEERELFGAVLDETSSHLLCFRKDNTCRVWSVAERRAGPEIATGFESGMVAFSADGRWLAAGDLAGRVRLWELADGRLAHEWQLAGAIEALDIDLEHGQLVAAGGELALFDLATGAERARRSESDWIFRRFTRSADGAVLVAQQESLASADTRYQFLAAADATPWPGARTLTTGSTVFDFAPSEDGSRLALADFSDQAKLWHRQDEPLDRVFEHETYPTLVRLTPDGSLLVTATSDGTVRLFDAESRALAFEPLNSDGRLEDLEVSWDGRYLLTSTARRARLWDLAVGRALTQPLPHEGEVHALRFARDGRTLWTASQGSGLQSWNVRRLELEGLSSYAGELVSCVIDAGAQRAAVHLADGRIRLLDLARELVLGEPWMPPAPAAAWTFSADGSRLALAIGRELHVLDGASGQPAGAAWTLEEELLALQLDPRGARAAVVAGNRTFLRELETGRVSELASPGVRVVDLLCSPDGRWLAARAVGTGQSVENPVLLWDLGAPGAPPRRIEHGDQVRALAFSPDSRWLATGTRGQIAEVWSVPDGTRASDPMFHAANVVREVLFSPDGRRLATVCGDQSVRVFDWREARPVSQVFATGGDVSDWAFSPDGKLLAVVAPDPANAARAFTRVFELSPPDGAELDLVALTEAASALRVSREGLPVACDPYEGWQRLAEAAPDLWFFRAPAQRSISPAFEASSSRWIKDDSVTVGQTRSAMPAVGMVRAAVACWNQRNLVRRRKAWAALDPASDEARKEDAELAALEGEVRALAAIAAREAGGDATICLWLSLQAEAAADMGAARLWIDRARELAPDEREVLTQARDVYAAENDLDAELAVLERLTVIEREVGLESELTRHRMQLGFNLWRRGEHERARAEFLAVLERPEIAALERVRMLALAGRSLEAMSRWAREMERDPSVAEDLDTFVLLAATLHRDGEVEQALQLYKALGEADPRFLRADELRAFGLLPDVEAELLLLSAEVLVRHPELAPQ